MNIRARMHLCQIPPDNCIDDVSPTVSQEISNMCISPSEESLAVSTDRGQLYSISLSSLDTSTVLYSL